MAAGLVGGRRRGGSFTVDGAAAASASTSSLITGAGSACGFAAANFAQPFGVGHRGRRVVERAAAARGARELGGPDTRDPDVGVREVHGFAVAVVIPHFGAVLVQRLRDSPSIFLAVAEAHGNAAAGWRRRRRRRAARRAGRPRAQRLRDAGEAVPAHFARQPIHERVRALQLRQRNSRPARASVVVTASVWGAPPSLTAALTTLRDSNLGL